MNGVSIRRGFLLAAILIAVPCAGQDYVVNGYTYVAPSYYPAPPIVVYDPAFVVPVATVMWPYHYAPPVGVVSAEPAFLSQRVTPYNPTWNYPPAAVVAPAPVAVRERARVNRNGLDYKYRAYAPGVAGPVYSYSIDSGRHGVKVRERVR